LSARLKSLLAALGLGLLAWRWILPKSAIASLLAFGLALHGAAFALAQEEER
jgi:hypothetical protein